MAKAVVTGVDTYRYVEDGVTVAAERGDTIDVSADEFDRVPGALSKPGKQAREAVAEHDTAVEAQQPAAEPEPADDNG